MAAEDTSERIEEVEMVRVSLSVSAVVLVGAVSLAIGASARADVDPGTRTVTTPRLSVQWSLTNPDEIVGISWNGSPT